MILKIDPSANQVLDLPQEQVDEMLKQVVPLTHKYLISTVSRVESKESLCLRHKVRPWRR